MRSLQRRLFRILPRIYREIKPDRDKIVVPSQNTKTTRKVICDNGKGNV